MSFILDAIGWRFFSSSELMFIIIMAGAVFLVMAYLTDVLMANLSFGVLGNTLLMMAGGIIGLVALAWLGYAPTRREYMHALYVCGLSSVSLLIGMVLVKRTY